MPMVVKPCPVGEAWWAGYSEGEGEGREKGGLVDPVQGGDGDDGQAVQDGGEEERARALHAVKWMQPWGGGCLHVRALSVL